MTIFEFDLELIQELGYLIVNSPASVDSFVKKFDLSPYEYKKSIGKIKQIQDKLGLILSFERDSITYEVTDPLKFSNYSRIMASLYEQYDFHGPNHGEILIQLQICFILLTAKEPIQIQEIADELGYSRSVIREPLKHAREFIESYKIRIDNIPHHGLVLNGSELSIRRCLASLYNWGKFWVLNYDHDLEQMSFQNGHVEDLIELIGSIFNKWNIRVSQHSRKRIRYYLLTAERRIDAGYRASLDLSIKESNVWKYLISETKCYKIAVDLSNALYTSFNLPITEENEIAYLTLVLASEFELPNRNYPWPNELEIVKQSFYEVFSDIFGQGYDFSDPFTTILEEHITRLLFRKHIGFLNELGSRYSGRPEIIYKSPLILKFINTFRSKLIELFQQSFSISQIIFSGEIVLLLVLRRPVDYVPIKVALISHGTLLEAQIAKELITANVKQCNYQSIDLFLFDDVMNHKEIFEKYDLVLADSILNEDYAPLYYVPIIDQLEDTFLNRRDLITPAIQEKPIIIQSSRWNNENELLVELKSDLLNIFKISNETINQALNNAVTIENHKLFVITDHSDSFILKIGTVDIPFSSNGFQVKNIILLVASIHLDNAHFFTTLLEQLVQDEMFFNSLLISPEKSIVNQYMNTKIK